MAINKISTPSYFMKRMRDSGYVTIEIFRNYSEMDPRRWTIMIDPGCASIYCTCYENASPEDMKKSQIGDFYYELYDGGQFVPGRFAIKTSSIEVIIQHLSDFGIINKSYRYNQREPGDQDNQE